MPTRSMEEVLAPTEFGAGTFPVKYLGIPLSPKK